MTFDADYDIHATMSSPTAPNQYQFWQTTMSFPRPPPQQQAPNQQARANAAALRLPRRLSSLRKPTGYQAQQAGVVVLLRVSRTLQENSEDSRGRSEGREGLYIFF